MLKLRNKLTVVPRVMIINHCPPRLYRPYGYKERITQRQGKIYTTRYRNKTNRKYTKSKDGRKRRASETCVRIFSWN